MQYRLRTLLILLTIGPLLGAIAYVQLEPRLVWRRRKQGPLIHQATFVGNLAYSDKKLAKVIDVHKGIRLNAYTAGESLRRVQAFYAQQGFSQVTVT